MLSCPSCTDPDCRGEQMHVPGSVSPRVEPAPALGKRRPLDDYPTPEWVILALAPYLGDLTGKTVLDPCCGSGAVLDVFRAAGANVIGIEISEERAAEARAKGHEVICGNALEIQWPSADLIVTNPPFRYAQEFAEKSLASVARGGTIALLLRLGFLASKRRVSFHRAHGSSVYVLASRPSFTANGACDMSDYGWFLWGERHSRRLHFLDAVDPARRSRTAVISGPEVKPIPGAPGFLARADGTILSTWRRSRAGQRVAFLADGEPKELAQFDRKTPKGEPTPYLSVVIKWEGGKRKNAYVHHLVALAFLGPRPEGAEVLHGSKGSSCNELGNLRYGSVDENSADRDDNWYRTRGICPPQFKERHDIEADAAVVEEADAEPRGAFDDLLAGAGE